MGQIGRRKKLGLLLTDKTTRIWTYILCKKWKNRPPSYKIEVTKHFFKTLITPRRMVQKTPWTVNIKTRDVLSMSVYLSICPSAQPCSVYVKHFPFCKNEDITYKQQSAKEFDNTPDPSKYTPTMQQKLRAALLSRFFARWSDKRHNFLLLFFNIITKNLSSPPNIIAFFSWVMNVKHSAIAEYNLLTYIIFFEYHITSAYILVCQNKKIFAIRFFFLSYIKRTKVYFII